MSFLFFSGGRSTTLSSFRAFFFISGGCSATLSIPNIHYSSTKDKRKRKDFISYARERGHVLAYQIKV